MRFSSVIFWILLNVVYRAEDDDDFDEDEAWSEASEDSSLSLARMTARQRAKELGEDEAAEELQSLPMGKAS